MFLFSEFTYAFSKYNTSKIKVSLDSIITYFENSNFRKSETVILKVCSCINYAVEKHNFTEDYKSKLKNSDQKIFLQCM